jgi:hypothetical protein
MSVSKCLDGAVSARGPQAGSGARCEPTDISSVHRTAPPQPLRMAHETAQLKAVPGMLRRRCGCRCCGSTHAVMKCMRSLVAGTAGSQHRQPAKGHVWCGCGAVAVQACGYSTGCHVTQAHRLGSIPSLRHKVALLNFAWCRSRLPWHACVAISRLPLHLPCTAACVATSAVQLWLG